MEIATVKAEQKLSIQTLGKRKIAKEGFTSDWMKECGQADLIEKMQDIIKHEGKVYGIFREKAEQASELQKVFEDGKAAYRMVFHYMDDEIAGHWEAIEEKILDDLKSVVEWGTVSGIEWGENLIYRKSMDKKDKDGMKTAAGYGLGFLSGWVIGWLVMDSIAFGLCFGVCYANLFGGIILSSSSRKQEWETYDFVNQKYIEDKEEV